MRTIVIFVLFNAFLMSSNLCAKMYFVGQNGDGNGSGESYSNRMSVAGHNGGSFTAGDIIYLCDTITSTVTPPSDGITGSPIIYRGDYPNHALSIKITTKYRVEAFNLTGRSYITLYNETNRAVISGNIKSGGPGGEGHNWKLINVANTNNIIIDNWEIKESWNGIKSDNVDNLTLIRCKIHLMRVKGIHIGAGSRGIKIGGSEKLGNEFYQNCYKTVYSPNKIGADIYLNKVEDVIISHNEIHGTNQSDSDGWGLIGIASYGVNRCVIEYNSIHDHGAKNYRAGIHLKGIGSMENKNIIIRYNNIYDQPFDDDWTYQNSAAVSVTRNSHDLWIYGNRIDSCQSGIGFNINGESGVLDGRDGIHMENIYIWGNSISNALSYGIALRDSYSGNTDDYDDIYVINNSVYKTIAGSHVGMTAFICEFNYGDGVDGTDDTGTAPHIIVKNNSISEGRYNQATKFNIYTKEDRDGDYIMLDNNLHYDSTNESKFNIKLGTKVIDYKDSATPYHWFVNEKIGNPKFRAQDSGDLTLTEGSLAIDTGESISTIIPSLNMSFYQSTPINFSFNEVLQPKTNWLTHPPKIIVGYQNKHGKSAEIGAYVYINDTANYSPSQVKNVMILGSPN